jgi:hypothetical protein
LYWEGSTPRAIPIAPLHAVFEMKTSEAISLLRREIKSRGMVPVADEPDDPRATAWSAAPKTSPTPDAQEADPTRRWPHDRLARRAGDPRGQAGFVVRADLMAILREVATRRRAAPAAWPRERLAASWRAAGASGGGSVVPAAPRPVAGRSGPFLDGRAGQSTAGRPSRHRRWASRRPAWSSRRTGAAAASYAARSAGAAPASAAASSAARRSGGKASQYARIRASTARPRARGPSGLGLPFLPRPRGRLRLGTLRLAVCTSVL